MQTDQAGKDFIKSNEGLVLTVQQDAGGKQKIGYGHDLLPGESFPNGIDEPFACTLLDGDAAKGNVAISALGWTLTQNQWNALSDFTYNEGIEALDELAAHGEDETAEQFPRWVWAKENSVETILPGLATRRAKEVALWNQV